MEGLVYQFDLDVLFRAEILLYLILSLVPHVVFDTEIKAKLLVFLVDVVRKTVYFDFLELLQRIDFVEKRLDTNVFVILIFE
jgi:hypothetical protein